MNIEVAFKRIFLVSPDALFCQNFQSLIPSHFEVSVFESKELCFQNIHQQPDIIFLEKKDNEESQFVTQVLHFDKNIPIILIQKNNNTSDNYSFPENVFNSISKENLNTESIYFLLKNMGHIIFLQNQVEQLEVRTNHDFAKKLVFVSKEMSSVRRLVEKAAQTNITCCLSGEKGTGKGTIAYLIHTLSRRKPFPFIHTNLSTINAEGLEKELFGLESDDGRLMQKGKLEQANQGTIYLENIEFLPTSIQVKLLNTLQSGTLYREGGKKGITLDVRFIVSSKNDLLAAMNEEVFLESLYYRIMGLPIEIPTLRSRENGILLLAQKFVEKFSEKNNFRKKEISKSAKKKLLSYNFPGNITELKSTIERAIVLSDNQMITDQDIEFIHAPNQMSFLDQEMSFEEYKSQIIHHYLKKYDNDILLVSNKLDIGKSTIYRMLKSEKEKTKKKMSWFNLLS